MKKQVTVPANIVILLFIKRSICVKLFIWHSVIIYRRNMYSHCEILQTKKKLESSFRNMTDKNLLRAMFSFNANFITCTLTIEQLPASTDCFQKKLHLSVKFTWLALTLCHYQTRSETKFKYLLLPVIWIFDTQNIMKFWSV